MIYTVHILVRNVEQLVIPFAVKQSGDEKRDSFGWCAPQRPLYSPGSCGKLPLLVGGFFCLETSDMEKLLIRFQREHFSNYPFKIIKYCKLESLSLTTFR